VGETDLAALVGPLWSEERATASLGFLPSPSKILRLVTSDGTPVYPVLQFVNVDGATIVKPMVSAMLAELGGFDGWTVAVLLNTPAEELGGLTPLDYARHGSDLGPVTDLARQVAREWSAGTHNDTNVETPR
jgi:hypothetical protein